MQVEVVCYGALKEKLPGGNRRATVDLANGADVGALVDELELPPRLVYAILLDGETVTLQHRLHEGAEVTLMPPFAGG